MPKFMGVSAMGDTDYLHVFLKDYNYLDHMDFVCAFNELGLIQAHKSRVQVGKVIREIMEYDMSLLTPDLGQNNVPPLPYPPRPIYYKGFRVRPRDYSYSNPLVEGSEEWGEYSRDIFPKKLPKIPEQ